MKKLMGKDRTILIVDDDYEVITSLAEDLEEEFGTVLTAANGHLALDVMKIKAVDVVVTDFKMPKMNGAELVAELKVKYPLIPVIIHSSYRNNPEIDEIIRAGVFDVVEKGQSSEILINRIKNALLHPLLIQVLWSVMSREWSPPKIEDFVQRPLDEQFKVLFAFSALLKTKSL